MMKKIISILVSIAMLLPTVCISVNAAMDFPGEETMYYADFEDENMTYANWGFDGSGSKAYISGKTGNGITPALVSGNFSYLERHLAYDFKYANDGNSLGAGTYHARFSYNSYQNASANAFYIANGTVNNASKQMVLSTDTLNSYGDQWVEVDLEFALPSMAWTVTVTPQTGDVYTGSGTYFNTSNQIPALQWWITPRTNFASTTPPTIDDFYVTKELKNTSLATNSLQVINNSGDAIDVNKVPVKGAFVTVDFGSEDIAAEVTAENVVITAIDDIDEENPIDYLGYCDGTKWVMELTEALAYGNTYTVAVKEGIPDGFGMEIEPISFEFSTISNTVSGLFYDFEDETKTYADLGFDGSGSKAYVTGKDGKGITAALVSGDFTYLQRHMGFTLNAVSDGTYHVTYDFKAGTAASESTFSFARGTTSSAPRSLIFDTSEMNAFGDEWVSIDLEFNVPSLEWKATITPENGEAIEKTGEYSNAGTYGVNALQWWITPTSNFKNFTPPTIDNFSVRAEYDNAPQITSNNITFYAGETEYEMTAVGVDADKIVLDFGQMMNTEDLTSDNFIIRKKTDGTEIPVGISYTGLNKVTLNVIPKTLEKNTDYELIIGNLRNVSDMEIGGTSVFEFSVTGAIAGTAAIKRILKDNRAVLSASDLAAGEATLYVECENISKLGLITLFYSGDDVVATDFSECNIAEDGNIGVDFDVTDEAFDKVEFILTNGFDLLKVLTEKSVLAEEFSVGESLTIPKNVKETSFDVTRNVGSDIVTITGNDDAEDAVLVFVVGEQPQYAAMIKADENGEFDVDMKFTESGEYKIYVIGSNDANQSAYIDFPFTVFSEYKQAIDNIVSATDVNQFVTLANANKEALGINNMYSEAAAKLYYKEFKNVIDNVTYDYDKNTTDFMRSYLIAGLNANADVDAADCVSEIYLGDARLNKYMDLYVANDTQKAFFRGKLSGKNIDVSERIANEDYEDELIDAVNVGLVLTSIKYADGPDEAMNVLKDFEDIVGIERLTSSKAVYNKIRGNDYNSINALKEAYSNAVKTANAGPAGGGNSGSSSSSQGNQFTGKSPVSSLPSESKQQSNNTSLNMKFEDLDSVDWAYADISELYEKGIISGVSNARFNPLGEVKREQFIKMIICAMDMEDYKAEYVEFADVPQGAWFEKYVSIAKQNGLVSGMGNNMFGIEQNITRQDMAVMLYNAMRKNGYTNSGAKNNFADSDACADYATVAIAELAALGVINGVGDDAFDPTATATRAQAAVIINRALEYLN